jgi:hypothetical protein
MITMNMKMIVIVIVLIILIVIIVIIVIYSMMMVVVMMMIAMNLHLRARPATDGCPLWCWSSHNTEAGAVSVECAADGDRTWQVLPPGRQSALPCRSHANSVGSMCKRRAGPNSGTSTR